MKREFKKGDRVLVRSNDLEEWQVKTFLRLKNGDLMCPFGDANHCYWTQCRHIDDFRTGDKVQVRDSETEEWKDAVYAVYLPHASEVHLVFAGRTGWLWRYKLCRWHPSMPWAEKDQPLTLEQRVEALERKLNE